MIKVNGYPIDAALSEKIAYEADITENEVEQGSDFSDHIHAKQPVITFEGVVSDTPIGAVAADVTRTNLVEGTRISRDAFQRFVEMHEAETPVELECSYGKFDQMALQTLESEKTAQSQKAFSFTATFRRIKTYDNRRVTVRFATPNSGGKVYLGNKESKEWSASLGVKDAIFVVSVPISLSPTWEKSWKKKPLLRRTAGARQFDCFEVQGGAQPDGFLTVNSSGSKQKYTYHPLSDISSMGGTPTSNSRGLTSSTVTTNVPTTIDGRPVHYDYGDNAWKDDRDNSVVKRVPTKAGDPTFNEDKWRGVTFGKNPPGK